MKQFYNASCVRRALLSAAFLASVAVDAQTATPPATPPTTTSAKARAAAKAKAKAESKTVSSSSRHTRSGIKTPVAAEPVPSTEPPPIIPLAPTTSDAGQTPPGVSTSLGETAAPPLAVAGPANDPALDAVVTDAMRTAVRVRSYDLDLHLTPATAGLEAHAILRIENTSAAPVTRLPLSISSSLSWQSVSVRNGSAAPVRAVFGQHLVGTDTDHTGFMHELVVTLPVALAPGASVELSAFYTGTVERDATRLIRIGAPVDRAEATDWDRISPELTALRGFGQVLWYPVAEPPRLLGDGAQLFNAVAQNRLTNETVTARLRVLVDYAGLPPDAVYFCGQRVALTASPTAAPEEPAGVDTPATGLATAEFSARALGFRQPSLFVTAGAPQKAADGLLELTTDHADAAARYGEAAGQLRPMLQEWLGPHPDGPVSLLDNDGQPFEDAALVAMPLRAEDVKTLAPRLVTPLAQAWFRSNHPWLQQGMAEFLNLLWIERSQGRDAAVARLNQPLPELALLEPGTGSASVSTEPGVSSSSSSSSATPEGGQPLPVAWHDLYVRNKSAAVLWMLRDQIGEDAMKQALALYRSNPEKPATAEGAQADADRLQAAFERTSGKDIEWLFHDWVDHDPGLPDLSINRVTPRALAVPGGPPRAGWLVAVEVHNDGEATADVPVTVRSGTLTKTERLRIAPHHNETVRIVFENVPEEVTVNDGTTPELRTTTHNTKIQTKTATP